VLRRCLERVNLKWLVPFAVGACMPRVERVCVCAGLLIGRLQTRDRRWPQVLGCGQLGLVTAVLSVLQATLRLRSQLALPLLELALTSLYRGAALWSRMPREQCRSRWQQVRMMKA
jgi:hypothetical protein